MNKNLFFYSCFLLKKFQLLRGFRVGGNILASENFHHPELFISDGQNPDMALWGQNSFYSFDVYFGIFFAAAMPYVHAKLEHRKTIGHYFFPEFGIILLVGFCFRWQVKMY